MLTSLLESTQSRHELVGMNVEQARVRFHAGVPSSSLFCMLHALINSTCLPMPCFPNHCQTYRRFLPTCVTFLHAMTRWPSTLYMRIRNAVILGTGDSCDTKPE